MIKILIYGICINIYSYTTEICIPVQYSVTHLSTIYREYVHVVFCVTYVKEESEGGEDQHNGPFQRDRRREKMS